MSVQIQLRRDTAANWTSANPTLAGGEMGIETDTSKYKFGDGVTAWTSLAYVTSGFANPMTTQDDIIVGGSAGAAARLAKGADGTVLTVDPTTHHLVWTAPASGFANPMTTKGDLIVGDTGGSAIRKAVGSDGLFLKADAASTGGVKWDTASGGSTGAHTPTFVRKATATNSTTCTVTAPTSGNRMIVVVSGSSAATTALTQTNVTYTKMGEFTTAGSARHSIWVGVVAASAGTSVVATNGSSFVQMVAIEVTTALTPTNTQFAGQDVTASTPLKPTSIFTPNAADNFCVFYAVSDNAGNQPTCSPWFPATFVNQVTGSMLWLAYTTNGPMTAGVASSTQAVLFSEIT